ncbi:MAG: ABC transporter permease, partial [Clostridia bacterium]
MKNKSVSMVLQNYLLLITAAVVAVIFGLLENSFFKPTNLVEIVRAAAIIGLMGLGETVVQASGEMDFAVGAETSFGAVMVAIMMTQLNLGFAVSFVLTMLLIIVIGLINSIIVVKVGIPSFVATLGMNTFINGINKYMTGGGTYYSTHWPEGFSVLGKAFLFDIIPMPAVLFIIGSIIVWIFLSKTRTGRHIYAVGANPNASKNVGINVGKHKMIAFVICAVCG